jgi:hypothetical protein
LKGQFQVFHKVKSALVRPGWPEHVQPFGFWFAHG